MKKQRKHVSMKSDDGVDYAFIAEVMSDIGYPMKKSSARNHVLAVTRKFAEALTHQLGADTTPLKVEQLARSANFQHALCEVLQNAEAYKRATKAKR